MNCSFAITITIIRCAALNNTFISSFFPYFVAFSPLNFDTDKVRILSEQYYHKTTGIVLSWIEIRQCGNVDLRDATLTGASQIPI